MWGSSIVTASSNTFTASLLVTTLNFTFDQNRLHHRYFYSSLPLLNFTEPPSRHKNALHRRPPGPAHPRHRDHGLRLFSHLLRLS